MLQLSRSPESKAAALEATRSAALDQINAITDAARRMFITPIAGQEMIYLNKAQEAKTYLSLPEEPGDLSSFPFIAGEIGTTGATAKEVATVFAMRGAAWSKLGAMMEHLRVEALAAIKEATKAEAISQTIADYVEDLGELS
jgi:hypothetical protein